MLFISSNISIPDKEIELQAMRSQGPGGQNVNKVSSAIHLRFDILASSLPEHYKQKLLALRDHRISKDGVLIIKSQQHRSQEQNRIDALQRLTDIIKAAIVRQKPRLKSRPSKAAKQRRLTQKNQRSSTKQLRGKVEY